MPEISPSSKLNCIAVIGTTGSGKTTLARHLSQRLNLPHIESDSHRFLPNWNTRSAEEFRAHISELTSQPRWIIDGNYSVLRDIVWTRADTLIWLDYPLHTTLWRLTRRTIKRIVTREDLWQTGNRETFTRVLSPNENSLFYWFFKTYWRRKRDTPILLTQYPHLHVKRFKYPSQTQAWLNSL